MPSANLRLSCVHRPVKSEQKFFETGSASSYNQSQVANPRPFLQAPGQQHPQPTNVYVTAQQYLQQHQHSQPPPRNPSVQQGTAPASHPYQPHYNPSQIVSQPTSGFRVQQPANPYLAQQQLAGRQFAYGNGQPQPVQQHAVIDADSRKRKAESTQVLSSLMCCCLLDTLSQQVIEPDGALGAIWC